MSYLDVHPNVKQLHSCASPFAKGLPVVLIFVLLCGCAESPLRIGMMDPEELAEVSESNLCYTFETYDSHDEKIRTELQRRDIFTPREWDAIDQGRIFVGMSEMAFHCSWSKPTAIDIVFSKSRIIQEEGSWGERTVYIYGESDSTELPGVFPKNVYIENGIVVGYQESHMVRCKEGDWGQLPKSYCLQIEYVRSTTRSEALLPP